ncbi:MAG: glycoside hydrolase family 99-like domain-containing protein [Roseiarcus sp.]
MSNEIPASNTPIRLLAPALWTPERFVGDSAWVEHAPFAFWLMDVLRPRNFVELGAQSGYSYFCFCQAVQRLRLGATCHAVDTWTGDEHAGFYSDEVFQSVARHNDRYSSFSTLLRTTFDDACRYFPDKSVDLLHIDGRHSYDDVRHDFETWRAKLADDAIVLFHGANVRELGFGVWKLFDELKRDHATFEFTHGRGLGVLAARDIPDALRPFFALDQGAAEEWRLSFASLGRNVKEMGRLRQAEAQLLETQERLRAANARAEAQLLETERQLKAAQEREAVVAGRDAQFVQLADELARAEGEIARLNSVNASPWRRWSDSTLWLKLRAAYRHPTNSSKRKRFRREEQERAPSSAEFAGSRRRWSDSTLWLKLRAAYRHPTNSSKRKRFRREEQERAPSSAEFAGSRRRWSDSTLWLKLRAACRHPTNSSKRKRFRREQQERALFVSKDKAAGSGYVPLFTGRPADKTPVKLICFYLPQFHAIPENNAWWGEGFTEWTNVRPAQPKLEGHYQPRVPGELGYYNLLDPAVQRRQIELAKLYGVGGFCFYIYWFGGKRLLEKPVENYLNDKTLDLPFCLCWANENWTRRWDGLDDQILIAQRHSPDDDLNFIRTVAVYMRDPRYIRVNGRPMLLVYRPALLPSAKETVKRWRAWCRSNGVGEIYLAYTQSFDKVDPAEYDFDAATEFPPNNTGFPTVAENLLTRSNDSRHSVYDWRKLVYQSDNYGEPDYKLFRGVCLAWDNTARRKNDGTIFINCTPALYQRWLENAIDDTRRRHLSQDEHLVFVNAWNEWAEGTYLEPDARYGYAYLEATRMTLTRAYLKSHRAVLDPANAKVAIVIHAYYLDVFKELIEFLGDVDVRYKIFITTCADKEAKIRSIMESTAFNFEIFVCENRGRDVLPFLSAIKQIDLNSYPFVLKLHTKKSPHRSDGEKWRRQAYLCLAKPQQLNWIIRQMCSDSRVGLVGPREHVVSMQTYYGSNLRRINQLAARLGTEVDLPRDMFVAGTMFVARSEALQPMLNLALGRDDFEIEACQLDGTMAHAVERAFTYSAQSVGLEIRSVGQQDAERNVPWTAPHL